MGSLSSLQKSEFLKLIISFFHYFWSQNWDQWHKMSRKNTHKYFFYLAPHQSNSQSSIISFGYVDFYAKIFLILYPWSWNSITGNAIMNTSNLLKKKEVYQTWWAHPSIQTTTRFFAMQCFARDDFHHDIPEIKTNLIKFISPKTTILIASANLIIFLLTKKCYNIPRWSYNM